MKKIKRCLALGMILSLLLSVNVSFFEKVVKGDQGNSDEFASEKEKFLYGYDVASGKNLMEPGALKTNAAIIDKNSDYLDKHVIFHEGFKQRSDNVVEYSLKKVSEEYAKKISADIYGRIFTVDTEISGEFDLSNRIENCKSEKYEMYTTWITNHYFDVDLKPYQIKNYLSEDFKKDLYNVNSIDDANRLFNTYGTHLNTGYMFGGRLNVTHYMSTDDVTHSLSKSTSLNQKMNLAISRINAGESASISEEYTSLENDKSVKSSYKFTSYGGRAISSLTVDDLFTFNKSYFDVSKSGFMYTIWINSINDKENLTIVGIPDNSYSLKIWELLDYTDDRSTKIREYLIDAYMKRCGDVYNDFIQGLDVLEHEIDPTEIEESSASFFEGLYLSTSGTGRYCYYVDKKDLEKSGSHYGIHNKEKIYLCFDEPLDSKDVSFKTRNCDIIDEKSGVFIVNSSGDNVVVQMIYEGKEIELINLPLITTSFEGGMGNEQYPYIITDKTQFLKIVTNMKGYYILCSDINFGKDSIPCLGDFEGQLDGNYCTISNFTIENSNKWGLFKTNSGTIKNLSIKNAGSSTNYQDFIKGGLNYEEDCKNPGYSLNAIYTESAGIICAENTSKGKIEGCYLENIFIRNINKNNDRYIFNSTVNIPVGVVTGTNEGEINTCMVKDSCILNAFIYLEKKKNFNCSVISGGLVGELKGGTVKSCVVDMGSIGLDISQSYMWYDLPIAHYTADVAIHSYSGGFVGYCNSNASIDNCFVYVRNETSSGGYHAIDALYKNNNTSGFSDAREHYALRGGSIICGNNSSLSSNKNWIMCKDSVLPIDMVRPTKNGDNRKENDTFERIPGVFINGGIGSEAQFDTLGLSNKYFKYDSRTISGVSHMLSLDRKDYLKISQNFLDLNSGLDLYVGQRYVPYGVNLKLGVNGTIEELHIFKYKVVSEYDTILTNFPLTTVGDNAFYLIFSSYDSDITTERIPINVHEKSLIGISIVDDDSDGKSNIYVDDIIGFKSNPLNYIKIMGILSDGTKENIELLVDNYINYLSFEGTEKVTSGDNTIKIKYNKGKDNFEIQTIIKVIDRTPVSLTIVNKNELLDLIKNNKDKYKENTRISGTDLLDNIHIIVDYDKGDSIELRGKEANSKLEIEGDLLSRGNNHIVLSYGNFDAKDSFDIEDVEENYSDEDDSNKNNQKNFLWLLGLALIIFIGAGVFVGKKWIIPIIKNKKINKDVSGKETSVKNEITEEKNLIEEEKLVSIDNDKQ